VTDASPTLLAFAPRLLRGTSSDRVCDSRPATDCRALVKLRSGAERVVRKAAVEGAQLALIPELFEGHASARTCCPADWLGDARSRHLIPDPARSSAKSPTCSGDSRVLVVDVGRDDRADPQDEAIESAVEQPGDADHGGDREHEGVVTEQFRDEEDRDEW
jgi:hypothetical protein